MPPKPPKPKETLDLNKEFIVTRVANGFMLRLPHTEPSTQPDPEKTIHVFAKPIDLADFVQNWAQDAESTPKTSGPSYQD